MLSNIYLTEVDRMLERAKEAARNRKYTARRLIPEGDFLRSVRKLLRKHGRAPRVLVTDKLDNHAAANPDLGINVEHRQHKRLNNRAENSHRPTRVRGKVMRRLISACHLKRFASVRDRVTNLFMHCPYHTDAGQKRTLRTRAFEPWESVAHANA